MIKENFKLNYLSPESHQLQMWFCRECNAVHFRIGVVTFNFTPSEFAQLAESCFDIYTKLFTVNSHDSRRETILETADIITSDTIA